MTGSALYLGNVTHKRFRPKIHALAYRVFNLLIDLDEGPALSQQMTVFGFNRRALISFFERDHGDGSERPLKAQIEAMARAKGLATGGAVRVLTYPRVLGFVFNPISNYFVHGADGALSCVVHEVNNTFGERCFYVLRAGAGEVIEQRAAKAMHVSPFMDMDYDYAFRLTPPGERIAVGIHMLRGEELWLTAAFSGERREFADRELFLAWLRHPLLTLKVIAGIHFEALRIWLKGVKYRPPPEKAPPRESKARTAN